MHHGLAIDNPDFWKKISDFKILNCILVIASFQVFSDHLEDTQITTILIFH